MSQCTVDRCERKYYAKGRCRMHYNRFYYAEQRPLYTVWAAMRKRCNNPRSSDYAYYGARGIKVCERWDNFANFVEDMGEKPTSKHTLDRIDNDGDYTPENCRWADRYTQQANRRLRLGGVHWDKSRGKWKAILEVKGEMVLNKRFKDKSDAIAARAQAEKQYLGRVCSSNVSAQSQR